MKRFVFVLLFLVGCNSAKYRLDNGVITMPPNSTDIKVLDENWIEFRLEDKKFLFGTFGDGHGKSNVCFPVN